MRASLLFLIFFTVSLLPRMPEVQANQFHPPLALPSQQQAPTQQTMQAPLLPELKDIEGPVFIEEQLPWLLIVPALAVALLLIGLVFLFIKARGKRKTGLTHPASLAFMELNHHKQQFEKHLEARTYITDVSETVRKYIEAEFNLHPTSQTTEEFIQSIGTPSTVAGVTSRLKGQKEQLKQLLELSDKAKFAHRPLEKKELENIDLAAHSFIQSSCSDSLEEAGEK